MEKNIKSILIAIIILLLLILVLLSIEFNDKTKLNKYTELLGYTQEEVHKKLGDPTSIFNGTDIYRLKDKKVTILYNGLGIVVQIKISLISNTTVDAIIGQVISDELVTMKIKEDAVTNIGATFILTSHTEITDEYLYGEAYILEYKDNDKWLTVPTIRDDYAWNMIGYTLNSNKSNEIIVDWQWLYGELPIGEYRMVKTIDYFRDTGDYDEYIISAEFSIK